MPEIDPAISQRIAGAARALNIARSAYENARDFETRKRLQVDLDRAQAEMIEASLLINRGVSRAAPAA